jgi:hypothetical protein
MIRCNSGLRTSTKRVALALAVGVAGTLAVASGPAEATIFERFDYAGSDVDEFQLCGIDVQYEAEFAGQVRIREGKGKDDGAFFLQDNYSGTETFTNPENGKFFTISHDGVFQDLTATNVEGSVFEFVTHEVGQPFVVRDMDGNVVLRDRGAITQTYLFDTEGDDVPGGIFLEELDLRISGPHPGFELPPGAECPAVIDLIG